MDVSQCARACEALSVALSEVRDALEIVAGEVELGGEEVYVRANLERASAALAEATAQLGSPAPG
ncbi:MAG TPA: hypothetical protein VKV23_01310 [Acidimicrobiales bacterium]|nr:hypothetical protein [Acidimicrobiales bacterium]